MPDVFTTIDCVVSPVLHTRWPVCATVSITESPAQILGDLLLEIVGVVDTPLSVTLILSVAALHGPLPSGSLVVSVKCTKPLAIS